MSRENHEVRESLIKSLRKHFPGFDEQNHVVRAIDVSEVTTYAGYETSRHVDPLTREMSTHFHLNLNPSVCYLLDIRVKEDSKGRGVGTSLYNAIEAFARNRGCEGIILTPSGRVRDEEFWERFGFRYIDDKRIEAKKILD